MAKVASEPLGLNDYVEFEGRLLMVLGPDDNKYLCCEDAVTEEVVRLNALQVDKCTLVRRASAEVDE